MRLGAAPLFFALFVLVPACTERGGDRPDVSFGPLDANLDAPARLDANRPDTATDADLDAWSHPDAVIPDGGPDRTCMTEVCSNGLDDDCNGLVDDGCSCVPGDTMACFRGAAGHRSRGTCMDGTMTCTGFEFGTWGPCTGDVIEAMETCDAAGLDEDCDGAPNDGCACSDGDPALPCGTDVGECVAGVQTCVGGTRTACTGETQPVAETCDGRDEDCDGRIDESLVRDCGSSVGGCRMGVATCTAGAWGVCVGEVAASTEACNGTDDDCDGNLDESTDRACGVDTGACAVGVEHCVSGAYAACAGATMPVAESCNTIDDDCDGLVDEALVRACGSSVGVCRAGTETCAAGAFGTCTGGVAAGTELCEGANDEDCDGTVDEACGCTGGQMRPCGSSVGVCRPGAQTCSALGSWGGCVGSIDPSAELCNGLDDDCDGTTDPGCQCITGTMRACGSSVGACMPGIETCDATGHYGPCAGATGPSTEVCNGRDDDCNGVVDDGNTCPRQPPLAMCPAARSTAVGTGVSLVSMGSDPDGGSVSFAWTVIARPAGSSAMPVPPGAATTSFTPDAAGDYTLRMCVTDDESVVTCCTTTVTATATCAVPATPTATTCASSWDRRPIVELTPLPSNVAYELYLDGASTPYATVTTVGQNYFRPASELAAGGPPPGVRASIAVRACRTDVAGCCSPTTTLSVNLIDSCTTPRAPGVGDVVFSEYVIDGDGACPGAACEAGEAFELTNLTNCPIALQGNHFFYCNGSCASGSYRWMDFQAGDVIPPRGVYVAIRAQALSTCGYPFFGPDDPSLFGLRVSTLAMQGTGLASGWFTNSGGGSFRIATGAYASPTGGTTLASLTYTGSNAMCGSAGYDAVNFCGDLTPTGTFGPLGTNQLGRLWQPCDAVVAPNPSMCR